MAALKQAVEQTKPGRKSGRQPVATQAAPSRTSRTGASHRRAS
jgi:hypothetical protein